MFRIWVLVLIGKILIGMASVAQSVPMQLYDLNPAEAPVIRRYRDNSHQNSYKNPVHQLTENYNKKSSDDADPFFSNPDGRESESNEPELRHLRSTFTNPMLEINENRPENVLPLPFPVMNGMDFLGEHMMIVPPPPSVVAHPVPKLHGHPPEHHLAPFPPQPIYHGPEIHPPENHGYHNIKHEMSHIKGNIAALADAQRALIDHLNPDKKPYLPNTPIKTNGHVQPNNSDYFHKGFNAPQKDTNHIPPKNNDYGTNKVIDNPSQKINNYSTHKTDPYTPPKNEKNQNSYSTHKNDYQSHKNNDYSPHKDNYTPLPNYNYNKHSTQPKDDYINNPKKGEDYALQKQDGEYSNRGGGDYSDHGNEYTHKNDEYSDRNSYANGDYSNDGGENNYGESNHNENYSPSNNDYSTNEVTGNNGYSDGGDYSAQSNYGNHRSAPDLPNLPFGNFRNHHHHHHRNKYNRGHRKYGRGYQRYMRRRPFRTFQRLRPGRRFIGRRFGRFLRRGLRTGFGRTLIGRTLGRTFGRTFGRGLSTVFGRSTALERDSQTEVEIVKNGIIDAIWTGVLVAVVKMAPILLMGLKLLFSSFVPFNNRRGFFGIGAQDDIDDERALNRLERLRMLDDLDAERSFSGRNLLDDDVRLLDGRRFGLLNDDVRFGRRLARRRLLEDDIINGRSFRRGLRRRFGRRLSGRRLLLNGRRLIDDDERLLDDDLDPDDDTAERLLDDDLEVGDELDADDDDDLRQINDDEDDEADDRSNSDESSEEIEAADDDDELLASVHKSSNSKTALTKKHRRKNKNN